MPQPLQSHGHKQRRRARGRGAPTPADPVVVDLSHYMRLRGRLSWLPGLFDLALFLTVLLPILGMDRFLAEFRMNFLGEPRIAAFDGGLGGLLVSLALVPLCMLGVVASKLPHLFVNRLFHLFVSQDAVWPLYVLIVLGCAAVLADPDPSLPVVVAIVVMLVVCAHHLQLLSRLQRHPTYHVFVRAPRSWFAWVMSRYELLSWRRLPANLRIILSGWRLLAAYSLAGMAMFLGMYLYFRWQYQVPTYWERWAIYLLVGLTVLRWARRVMARELRRIWHELRLRSRRDAAALSSSQPASEILFLRSFRDDGVTVDARAFFSERLFAEAKTTRIRLEELIADTLFPFAPMYAIQDPDQKFPPLGAAKVVAPGDGWQARVDALISRSSMIVLMLGTTSGLRWERDHVLRRGMLDRCVFVVPPEVRMSQRDEDWELLTQASQRAARAPTIAELQGTLLAFSDPNGRRWLVKGEATARAYAEALRFAAQTLCDRDETPESR